MKKKFVIAIMSLCLVFGVTACSSFNEGVQDAMEESDQAEETQETEETPETESQEPEESAEPEEPSEANEEAEQEAPEETGNPLMDAEIQVHDVMNGSGTEKIGERAEVNISKAVLETVTDEQFSEFCNEVVGGSGYNWFTIVCDDGTGIVFNSSIVSNATYGEIDNEGVITTALGYLLLEDGAYTYTEAE